MKILVTGAGGFVGSRFLDYYKELPDMQVAGFGHHEMDITSLDGCRAMCENYTPDVVVHGAAISSTMICEKNPDLSYHVNVTGAENMAAACKEINAKLIFLSSDQVYAASKQSKENKEEFPHPAGVYSNHKLEAEQRVLSLLPESVCLRLTWMFDLLSENEILNKSLNQNFLLRLLEHIGTTEKLELPIYEFRGISYVYEVVENISKAWKLPGGVYNFGSRNQKSTFELGQAAQQIVQQILHLEPQSSILEANSVSYADLNKNIMIDTCKAESFEIHFQTAEQAIERCLKKYKSRLHIIAG